jgi:acyl-ACP thioesterase
MKDISIWKEKFRITHSLVAPDGFASIHGLAYCLQETAVNHASAARLGYDELIKLNLAWVLTRQLVKLYKIPKLNEKITVETWAAAMTDTIAVRDFNILNKELEILGICRTSWMLIDLKLRKPVRIPKDMRNLLPKHPERLKEDIMLDKISISENTDGKNSTYHVVYSDLDMNHHVNNINYLKWVLDDFEYSFRQKFRLGSIEINYLAEAIFGDELVRTTIPGNDNEFLTNIIKKESSKPILTSKTKWLPKD